MDETNEIPNTFSLTSPPLFMKKKSFQKSSDVLEKWYNTLTKERVKFMKSSLKRKVSEHVNFSSNIKIEFSI